MCQQLTKEQFRLGERRVYMPVVGWDYDEPPADLKPVVSGVWWMGYRLVEEQDNANRGIVRGRTWKHLLGADHASSN